MNSNKADILNRSVRNYEGLPEAIKAPLEAAYHQQPADTEKAQHEALRAAPVNPGGTLKLYISN